MKKNILFIILLIVLSTSTIAWKDSFRTGEEMIVEDVIEVAGEGAWCNITVYQNTTLIDTANMTSDGLAYSHNLTNLSLKEGYYVCNIECNHTNSSFIGECNFEVEVGDDMFTGLAIMIFTNISMFLIIFWLLNNLKYSMEQSERSLKAELVIKFLFIFLAFLLNLAVVGFTWYTSNMINAQLARMAFLFFILNIIGIIAFTFYIGFKMFTLPVEALRQYLIKLTGGEKKDVWSKKK